jgi:lysophospholipase L1-like esterase
LTRPESSPSFAANLLLVAGSLLFTGLLLALLEGGLRLLEVGPPRLSRLAFQQIDLPVLEPGTRADGTEIWRTRDPRHAYQSLPRAADSTELRVFTFGASATAGLGFSPNVTFSHNLERMLERAYPDRGPVVVNLGIVGISSEQVKLLVADVCLRYAPDLVVVYSGSNEFLELHAKKYAEVQATIASRGLDLLMSTRLYHVTQRLLGRDGRNPSLAGREFREQDFELARSTILGEIDVTPEEIEDVVDRYEENLDEIARIAHANATPLVLMTVGSNWRWRGREDLPHGWLDELLGDEAPASRARWERADRLVGEQLETSAPAERHEWLFRRAVVAEALGDVDAARTHYRAAMNEDPHLRRALDTMNDRVRTVAAQRDATLVDTVEWLASRAEQGIVGFDEYFDHVHFTPRGAEVAAAALFAGVREAGVAPAPRGFDAAAYLSERLASLDGLESDALDVGEWMGFGFDPAHVADRDLWKYDRMVLGLDARIEEPGERVRALVYRGNARYFRIDGAEAAERDYRAALAADEHNPVIRANLSRLLAEGRQ